MFMSSSRDEFTRSWKNWVTDVSAAMLVPLRGTQTWRLHRLYELCKLKFLLVSRMKKFLRPESWRWSLYIDLLSFPRFWILSIKRF